MATMYLVTGHSGEYSEYREWTEGVTDDLDKATNHAHALQDKHDKGYTYIQEHWNELKELDYDEFHTHLEPILGEFPRQYMEIVWYNVQPVEVLP